ncbi:hypothetical protein Aduo_011864 [Ancylostoma duodenale]
MCTSNWTRRDCVLKRQEDGWGMAHREGMATEWESMKPSPAVATRCSQRYGQRCRPTPRMRLTNCAKQGSGGGSWAGAVAICTGAHPGAATRENGKFNVTQSSRSTQHSSNVAHQQPASYGRTTKRTSRTASNRQLLAPARPTAAEVWSPSAFLGDDERVFTRKARAAVTHHALKNDSAMIFHTSSRLASGGAVWWNRAGTVMF